MATILWTPKNIDKALKILFRFKIFKPKMFADGRPATHADNHSENR